MKLFIIILGLLVSASTFAEAIVEIDASPFATEGAPISQHKNTAGEKAIIVYPREHFYGAYNARGNLIRWGIATTGADFCKDVQKNCRTKVGTFRIYSLGNESCTSKKYPLPDGGAPMPYCMYFIDGQAIHGSTEVEFKNASHGCVRVHLSDAKWLRYQFVEGPKKQNNFQGTKIIVVS